MGRCSHLVASSRRPAAVPQPARAQSRKASQHPGIFRFHFHAYSPPALHSLALTSPPLYSKMLRPEFPLRPCKVFDKRKHHGRWTTAIRTAASVVTSMTLLPFRLSIWLLAMK